MTDASTSPRIIRLPPQLIDQIAAGEVVERAASVVKELCENSIDAGARRIDVEITAGGRTAIRIVDDGCGMSPQDLRLALERHATSKIRCADDLWGVQTFGFRGEALPSIASVSRLMLQSRPADADEGFLLRVEAGREMEARAVGMPQGTQIEVRDLFFNTPARLKFQKTEATETSNVSEALLRLAVANPDVHFRLRSNGRVAMDLPPHRDLSERVRAAMSRRGAGVLHEAVGDENGVCVQAFLAAPDCASTTARNTFLFVGRRFVRDRSLLQAVCMGYGETMEKGRYPLAALFLDVPGDDLDVNVHPQKLEVRFAQPQPVYAAVRHVLSSALARAPWMQTQGPRAYSLPPGSLSKAGMAAPSSARSASHGGTSPQSLQTLNFDNVFPGHSAPVSAPMVPAAALLVATAAAEPNPIPSAPAVAYGAAADSGALSPLRYIGALSNTFLLLEAHDGGLVLVDQHAAHERVMFEKLRSGFHERRVAQQRLLFPIPIEVDDAAMASLAVAGSALERLGFDVGAFGAQTLLVRAVPELLVKADPKPLVLDVLARLAEDQAPELVGAHADKVLATMACHSAVRAGDGLDPPRVQGLLQQLDGVDWRSHCPHGRPVLIRMSLSDIERQFGRI